tara:strand:- start:324 stop:740 length:417 start_codon:yes stop_codon:yes gene_type:complete
MKITKTQLQKVIQEELRAELNEAQQSKDIPKLLGWYSTLINTAQEEGQVIGPLLQAILSPSKLPGVQKMKMVADAFEAMGADGGVVASQVRKALQQQESSSTAGGPPPYAGGGGARVGGIPSSQRNPLDDFTGVERKA